ncbi:MAG: DUF2029 domain-containing protein [Actinomycetota bacterium]|nr:DUF2029 domain-containing protein [Actinomycetota bacterium]
MLSERFVAGSALRIRPVLDLGRGVAQLFLFGALPLCYFALFVYVLAGGLHTFDFHTFWRSGYDVLHGHSPYPGSLPAVADRDTFRPFVYPAPAAIVMAPISLIPFPVANVLWAIVGIAAIAGALRLLDVRDWRCYGAAFASAPVWSSLINGAISSVLVLGCAALWRYRSRPWAAAALLAGLIVLKLYLWPLAIWLLATRRFRASLLSVAIAVAVTFGAWAAIGFAGLREYPHLIDRLTTLVGAQSYSPYAFFRALGASDGTGRVAILACGVGLLACVVAHARRSDREGSAFVLAIGASLVLTPIVWPHYFVLMLVPLAIARPRIGYVWAAPMLLWFFTPAWSGGDANRIGIVLAVATGALAWTVFALRPSRPRVATAAAPPLLQFGIK